MLSCAYHLLDFLYFCKFRALVASASRKAPIASRCFALGTLLFSGSLYAMVLTDEKRLGDAFLLECLVV